MLIWQTAVSGIFGLSAIFSLVFAAGISLFLYFNKKLGYYKKLNNELKLNQEKFEEVLDNSNDMTYQINLKTGEYMYMSKSIVKALGYTFEEMHNSGPAFFLSKVHPNDLKALEIPVYGNKTDGILDDFQSEAEFRIKRVDGEYIWAFLRRTLIFDNNGEPLSVIGNGYDITERKIIREQLDESLKEKDILLAEIHHRVKNNLAVISSLLLLQKDNSEKKDVQDALTQSSNRVQSIAEIHELLYQNESFSHLSIGDYLNNLLNRIITSNSTKTKISHEVICDEMNLSLNLAVPLGLMVNELVTNSCKHAFDGRKDGHIEVQISPKEKSLTLEYKDNGKGVEPDFFDSFADSDTLGLQLIHALLAQISSDFELIHPSDGFHLKIEVAVNKN